MSFPSVASLEANHKFPCPYIFKVIGRENHYLEQRVVAAVRDQLGATVDPPYSVRTTEGGKHIAITFEILMEDAHQVISVYRRLTEVPGILLLL